MKLLQYCSRGVLPTYLIATAFMILGAFFILDFEDYDFARMSLEAFALIPCLAAIKAGKVLMHLWRFKQPKSS